MWHSFDITTMYNITGDSGVNFCKKFKVFYKFYQIFNGAWICEYLLEFHS